MGIKMPPRSALDDYPGQAIPAEPTVTVVVPLYNEIEHIQTVIDALLAQDYPALVAIYFVDGLSTDGTYELLQQAERQDSRIHVVQNPQRIQAAGINLAFAKAQSDIVMRIDGHAHYAHDVVRCSVAALLESGAGGVGAIARPLPSTTYMGQSIVAAHESRFGIGAAKFRQESAHGWVDTVWNGCYWRHVVERVGRLREDLPRTEDNDFHGRLRALGYGLYLSPTIKAYYHPRRTLRSLASQYFGNGVGIAEALHTSQSAVNWRHLAPFGLVCTFLVLMVCAFIWRPALYLWALLAASYTVGALIFTALAWWKRPGRYALLLPLVFATLHGGYGLGTLWGLCKFKRRNETQMVAPDMASVR